MGIIFDLQSTPIPTSKSSLHSSMILMAAIITGLILTLWRYGFFNARSWRRGLKSCRGCFRTSIDSGTSFKCCGIDTRACLLIAFCSAFSIALLLHVGMDQDIRRSLEYLDTVQLEEEMSRSSNTDAEVKVVVVTTTIFSLVQVPRLIRLAQALYPVRNDIIWVVVSITEEEDLIRTGKSGEGKGPNHLSYPSRNCLWSPSENVPYRFC